MKLSSALRNRELRLLKTSADDMSSLPPITINPQPASRDMTLPGMASPQPSQRVNTFTPVTPDAGSQAQKSQPAMGAATLPKTAESGEGAFMANTFSTPQLKELAASVRQKTAMRVKLAEEAKKQVSDEDANGEDANLKKKNSNAYCGPDGKMAHVTTKQAEDLASALDYVAVVLDKQANFTEPPPGATAAHTSGTQSGQMGHSTHNAVHPPKVDHVGKLENTEHKKPGGSATQGSALSAGTGKVAASTLNRIRSVVQKQAAEGPGETPPVTDGSQAAPVPANANPSNDAGVQNNEAAINLTKGQAYANRKTDLKNYLNEPALSAKTDPVLQQAFSYTGQAGTKISSAQALLQVAASRAMIQKLAEADEQKRKEEEEKKKKEEGAKK